MESKQLKQIVSHFETVGTVDRILPLGSGLVNDTYRVVTQGQDTPDYALQRINDTIFTDVDLLQRNIQMVTAYIRQKLEEKGENDLDRKMLRFVQTARRKTYYKDDEDPYWRISLFTPDAKAYETVNPEYSYHAGKAFGNFESILVDMPEQLGEIIPDLRNVELRMHQLREAVAEDKVGRVAEMQPVLDGLEQYAKEMCRAERLYREGKLKKRICHCDTKVNNMVFDQDGKVLCVTDLDTVMPSLAFSDYGDFLRIGADTVAEDSKEFDQIDFRMDIFETFTKGYLESAQRFLGPIEMENLPYAAKLFLYMQRVRLLADYINGDTYYKINYDKHNLVRTQNQLCLFRRICAHEPEIVSVIHTCLNQ